MSETVTKQSVIDALNQLDDQATPEELKKAIEDKLKIIFPDTKVWQSAVGRRVFITSLVLAIITPVLICIWHTEKWLMLTLYAGWSIGPPTWFLFEYVWIFPDPLKYDTTQFGDLKYVHELAGKIWAALVVVMTAILVVSYGFKFTEIYTGIKK